MKKFLMFSILFGSSIIVKSQSVDDIGKMVDNSKFIEAKAAVDKFLADPKNASNIDGWYFKARIYNSLSRDAATSKDDSYNQKISSFEALKKHVALDKKGIRMTLEQNKSFLDLYLGFYDLGSGFFQNKSFGSAFNSFEKAQVVEDYILSKNFTYDEFKFSKIDTNLIVNTAAAAINNADTTNGILYYKKITNANIGGKDYQQIYEYLGDYYRSKKDQVAFQDIIAKGKMLYPQSTYWDELELSYMYDTGDKKGMFAKYESQFEKDPSNFTNTYNYAVELYNILYDKNANTKDSITSNKLTEILKIALKYDKEDAANMLYTNHLYNLAAEYSQAAALIKDGKLAKPADIKMKKDLNALAVAKLTELIPYAENTVKYFQSLPTLKNSQKAHLRTAASYLYDAYKSKNNIAKADEYDKLKESIKF